MLPRFLGFVVLAVVWLCGPRVPTCCTGRRPRGAPARNDRPRQAQGSSSQRTRPGAQGVRPKPEARTQMGRIASPQNSGVSQAGPGFPSTQRLRATRPRGGGLPCAHVRGGGRPPQVGDGAARAPAAHQTRSRARTASAPRSVCAEHNYLFTDQETRGRCNWAKTNLVEKKWPDIIWPKTS